MKTALMLAKCYHRHLLGLILSFPMALTATASVSNTIRCDHGFLSVKVQDLALGELLNSVARQCGFAVVSYGALEQPLSMEFHGLTLTQGLRRILGSRSYALKYAPTAPGKRLAGATRAETLWILPQGNEKTPHAVPVIAGGNRLFRHDPSIDVSRWGSILSNGNVEDREQAAMALGKRGHVSAVAPLSQALADNNAEVREAAIASLAEIGGADAAQALAVALRDGDPRVREQAVDALGDVGGQVATDFLRQAVMDEVAYVRQAANEMLEQLNGKTP